MSGAVVIRDSRRLILHVLHHLVTGGMENGLVNLINHLPESRWRHRVLCIEDYSEFRGRISRSDVEVIALRRSQIGTWAMRRRIFEECRACRPAIVHTRNLSGLDALPPAWLAGGSARVHSEHGWDVDNLDGRQPRPALLRRLHSVFVDKYVTVSKDLEDHLTQKVGIAASRIVQIYNGVDVERFRPRQGLRSSVLPPAFAGPNILLVGTVGRLQRVKDQRTLLRAVARLEQRCPETAARLRVAIVGGGPMNDALRQEASDLGVAAKTWFAGPIHNVPEVLSCFDVFVLPSLMEGTSNTLLEAMACGMPVLATGVGGNLEIVRPGVVGEFFRPGDVEGLSTLLQRLAEDPSLVRSQGQRARATAVDEFSLSAMIHRYGKLYDSVASAKGQ